MDEGDTSAGRRVEKTMTLTRAEFANSLAALVGHELDPATASVAIALTEGVAHVTYEPLAAVRLGGLLELPRARVVISFEAVPAAERTAFLQRFDIAFQRGGG